MQQQQQLLKQFKKQRLNNNWFSPEEAEQDDSWGQQSPLRLRPSFIVMHAIVLQPHTAPSFFRCNPPPQDMQVEINRHRWWHRRSKSSLKYFKDAAQQHFQSRHHPDHLKTHFHTPPSTDISNKYHFKQTSTHWITTSTVTPSENSAHSPAAAPDSCSIVSALSHRNQLASIYLPSAFFFSFMDTAILSPHSIQLIHLKQHDSIFSHRPAETI